VRIEQLGEGAPPLVGADAPSAMQQMRQDHALFQAMSPRREALLDCTKGALILLVVLGHFVEIFIWDSTPFRAVYAGIYIFHMPLFVATAGYFAKSSLNPPDARNMVTRIVVPLLVMQVAYVLPLAIAQKPLPPPLVPYWMLWFLASLLTWRIFLPLFASIRGGLAIAVALAIAAGYSQDIGSTLSVARTVYFFPFFLAGYLYGPRLVLFARTHRKIFAAAFALVAAAAVWWALNGLDVTAFYGSKPYSDSAAIASAPAAGRLLLIVAGAIACIGFVAVVPQSNRWLEHLGQRTMAIFLLHGFFVLAARAAFKVLGLQPSWALLCALGPLALLVCYVTSLLEPLMKRIWDTAGTRWLRLT
jgi:fucose 4-O-acetylase-like acetyltransferase